jgi:glycosyltransferase involved in cell wall biosynthesis
MEFKVYASLVTLLFSILVFYISERRFFFSSFCGQKHDKRQNSSEKLEATVHWMAPFFSGGGYCTEAITFVSSLFPIVPNLSIEHHGDTSSFDFVNGLPDHERRLLLKLQQKARYTSRKDIVICHSEPGAWFPPLYRTSRCPPPGAKYKIGRTMFETDRIPRGWVQRCNSMDEIWVPTAFHISTFANSGVKREKLFVVPEPVDVKFFDPQREVGALPLAEFVTSPKNISEHAFKFLSIFKVAFSDFFEKIILSVICGVQWEKRKAWDVLLEAYLTEFTATDPVVLYILTNPYHADRERNPFNEIEKFLIHLTNQTG